MGHFLTKSRIYESVALVMIAFVLFRPDFVMDRIQPPFDNIAPQSFAERVEAVDPGREFRVVVDGPDFDTGEMKETTLLVVVPDEPAGSRMTALGLATLEEGDAVALEEPMFGTPFADTFQGYDFYGDEFVTIKTVKAPADQMPKELVFIPGLIALFGVVMLQRGRMRKEGGQEVAA